jgi:DNA-binding GntR family transcriptional regulator
MSAAFASERSNLSTELSVRLRKMIVDGELPAGGRINEVHLSALLGVSRTPLREALTTLAQEGALASVPRIGWFVRPLTLDEFEQIYPIRSFLDPEALRLAGCPSAHRLRRLRKINDRIVAEPEPEPEAIISLDDEWHMTLLETCPNTVLLDLIRQFMWRTRRYELALMREGENVSVAIGGHERIIAALDRGDLEGACTALRKNMATGSRPISDWLRSREDQLERKT